MKVAHSLYMQTLGMVLFYLVTLCIIVFVCFNAQFGIGWEALLKSPFGDRVDTIADAISSNLQSSDKKHWTDVLKNFDKLYSADFFVIDVRGEQLAGKPLSMPKALEEKVVEFPPGMPIGFPPPGDHIFGFAHPGPPGDHFPEQAGHAVPFDGHFEDPIRHPGSPNEHFPGSMPSPPNDHFPGSMPAPSDDHVPGRMPGPPNDHFPGRMPGPPDDHFPGRMPGPTDDHFLGRMPGPPDDHFPSTIPDPLGHGMHFSVRTNGDPDRPGLHIERGIHFSAPGFDAPHMVTLHSFHPRPFMHAQGRFILHTRNPDTFFVGTKIMLFDTEHMHPLPCFVIAATNNIWQSTLLFDFRFLFMIGGLILVLSLLFWWPFVHQISRSIGELTAVTERIAEGKFDTRIVPARQDEIGRLADAVNTMAEKLNQYVLTQKRFLADVSHELFSPLARLHMALELLETCKPEDSSRHFKEINEEIEEMKSLITELLAYSKAGLVQSERQLSAIDLKPIFDDLVDKFGDQMEIKVALDPKSIVEGDATLISRSLSNVIRNSIRYAGEAGPLAIESTHDGSDLIVKLSDCGPGVPEETIKYLGEPFFRPEFSRNRNLGGFGLGLAIVKSCIEACNGSVTLSNLPTGGLRVQIRLKAIA